VRPGGQILVLAWALEQPPTSPLFKHPLHYLEEGNQQDVLVPWTNKADGTVHQRYYHLFREGELQALSKGSDLLISRAGYNKDNWYAVYHKQSS